MVAQRKFLSSWCRALSKSDCCPFAWRIAAFWWQPLAYLHVPKQIGVAVIDWTGGNINTGFFAEDRCVPQLTSNLQCAKLDHMETYIWFPVAQLHFFAASVPALAQVVWKIQMKPSNTFCHKAPRPPKFHHHMNFWISPLPLVVEWLAGEHILILIPRRQHERSGSLTSKKCEQIEWLPVAHLNVLLPACQGAGISWA